MKEASGELNMTVVTIIAIGAVIAFFWVMWPTIKDTISNTWRGAAGAEQGAENCTSTQAWDGTQCVDQ